MNTKNKVIELRQQIYHQLRPLIEEQCILTDLPYHDNLGDVLIWQGELDFLESINKSPTRQSNYLTFDFPPLETNTTILLHGGGNFGDLYRILQEFRLKIIRHYLDRRIIVLPQSVHYDDPLLIAKDAEIMAQHKDLYLCARDMKSYEFMKKHFKNNILLIPDMAFYINKDRFTKKKIRHKDILYLKRGDGELDKSSIINIKALETHDWPTYELKHWSSLINYWLYEIRRHLPKKKKNVNRIIDLFAQKILRKDYVEMAIKFLLSYRLVITTRLHALILSFLLDIPVKYIDNTTGKLSSFVDTWLSDCSGVETFIPSQIENKIKK